MLGSREAFLREFKDKSILLEFESESKTFKCEIDIFLFTIGNTHIKGFYHLYNNDQIIGQIKAELFLTPKTPNPPTPQEIPHSFSIKKIDPKPKPLIEDKENLPPNSQDFQSDISSIIK